VGMDFRPPVVQEEIWPRCRGHAEQHHRHRPGLGSPDHKSDLMYAKRAFFHRYVGEGTEDEGEER
ncbi:hypothetical protein NHX12_000662, partial [Muraenolepis orangiensis]